MNLFQVFFILSQQNFVRQKSDIESGLGQIKENSGDSATRPDPRKLLELLAVAKHNFFVCHCVPPLCIVRFSLVK